MTPAARPRPRRARAGRRARGQVGAALAALIALAAPPPAAAQRNGTVVSDPAEQDDDFYVPELRSPLRSDVGFDIGLGLIGATCAGCERALGGLALDLYGGALVTRRIAVLAAADTVLHLLPVDAPEDRGLVSHTTFTANARVWAMPQVWLQAGAGAGLLRVDGSADDGSDWGPVASLAVGREVDHRPARGVNVTVRAWLGRYDDEDDAGAATRITLYSVAASVGWHWL
ncbi:MAG: hypothetical protein D6689_16260 [Deltaproteobacteria bacterium]|nr:MAG: hypothetical protein D6689_16260 [Deltaproteobacteria bacterium]